MPDRIGRNWVRRGALTLALLAASCRNPFVSYPEEYGLRIDEKTLRSTETLELEEAEMSELDEVGGPLGEVEPDDEIESLDVSIELCRAWVLQHNLNLHVSLLDPDIAETVVNEEEARFESTFFTNFSVSDADPTQAIVFPDEFILPAEFEAGVDVPMRTGGSLRFSAPAQQDEDFGFGFEPYSTDLQFSISQPLLRGAGRRANMHPIRIAALGSQIDQARTKLEVIRELADADRTYWLLYEARMTLLVRLEQIAAANEQLAQARARFQGGLGPEIEVVRAEAGLSRRLSSIIIARLVARDRARLLKRLMNHPDADVDSSVRLGLTSEPDPIYFHPPSEEILDVALEQRVELLELELQLAQDLSTIDFAENRKLPKFTLDYTYRLGGAGGSVGDSLESLGNGDESGWKVGMQLSVPIGNEAAEARYHRALLVRLQRLATRSAREQSIKEEVLNALDNLEATWHRIIVARENVMLETRNFRAEQGQYSLGLRNSTEVLDAESRLTDARIDEIESIVDYQIAQVDLAFATGTLLGAAKVTW